MAAEMHDSRLAAVRSATNALGDDSENHSATSGKTGNASARHTALQS